LASNLFANDTNFSCTHTKYIIMSLTPIIFITFCLVFLCTAVVYDLGQLPIEDSGCSLPAAEGAKAAAIPVGNCISNTINAKKKRLVSAFEEGIKKVRDETGVTSPPGSLSGAYLFAAVCTTFDNEGNPASFSASSQTTNTTENPLSLTPCGGVLVTGYISLKTAYNLTGTVTGELAVVEGLPILSGPIAGAVVSVASVPQYTTGVDGKYTVLVYNGTNTVQVTYPGYQTESTNIVVVNADATLNFNLALLVVGVEIK